jgi:hypothetical protein
MFRKLADPYGSEVSEALIQECEAIEAAASKIIDHAVHLQASG